MDACQTHIACMYCNITFADKTELRNHCQTEMHEIMIMSDEGRDWHWRPPPRGFKSDTYALCDNWQEKGNCRYGQQCVQAHGENELSEWKERFRYRQMKLQRAKEKELFGKSYTEELLEKWMQSANPNSLMRTQINDVDESCSSSLNVTVSSKDSFHEWVFVLRTKKTVKAIVLLRDTHRNHFSIKSISHKNQEIELKNDQEWICNLKPDNFQLSEYKVKVIFHTSIFGTFRQSIVFDFSTEPVLVKNLCVDVVPDADIDKINEIRREIKCSISERWTAGNSEIVPFHSTSPISTSDPWEKRLKTMYPCPQTDNFIISHATVTEKRFTKNNYRERMHELLYVEEMARFDLIRQYNVTTKLQLCYSYILSPNSMATTTAKYASNGELYASISLGKELSEDTSEGRLILMHCNTVYLCPTQWDSHKKRIVFEALIEDKSKNIIYLRLSKDTVQELRLTPQTDIEVQIQFQLNRLPYCEWHYVLDKMTDFKQIFPETYLEPIIPWSPSRQWSKHFDCRLNIKQKEAVVAITTPLAIKLPPILVIGPFGTGKTFTLAQAVKELIKDTGNRVLLCTHSNSAADLYIKDYFNCWVEEGVANARPLRIYYQKRWVTTVNPIVQKYCLIETKNGTRSFKVPSIEDIIKHQIIVVTLSTSVYLSSMGLPLGYFTHILLDEAAQSIECETVTPLALANENTRVVLAGDHMQLGPDIFSAFARKRNLHISLLERLYDHYPSQFPCKILLCENYRAHESIIQFTSESFYDQKLISSSKQPRHSSFYPLTFFTTRGEDIQDKNSTAFYNNSEVYEVVDRVAELKRSWPEDWGPLNDQSIGVVTPYADQVFRIRSELRRRKIDNVCVERVLNVQGKQFRAIILSTVRTRNTCVDNDTLNEKVDYGFLSNSKLLNTAITRAQSLVAVVGDPIALCSLGRCSKVWERFIQICNENQSLYGITWNQLKFQLHGIELKKIYNLNPLAPEFIPRKYREKVVNNFQPKLENYMPNSVNIQNIQNDVLPPHNLLRPIIPSNVNISQFTIPDCHFYPIYPPPPRQFLFNGQTPLANIVPQSIQPLPNGYSQHIGMVNPPILVPPRPITTVPPIQVQKPARFISFEPPPFVNKPPSPPSNKLIQFMNNVHFPEANSSVFNDCINLLPQNMSLADMLLQPSQLQERWYNFLKESSGEEAAEKFKYLLLTTNQKGSRLSDNIFESTTPQSCESPSWFDNPTNQININKPVYMQEHAVGEQCNGHNAKTSHHPQVNGFLPQLNEHYSDIELQRHINEDFANLSISSPVNDVFKALVSKDCSPPNNIRINKKANVGPRFYKFFQ